ncbi:MAG: hypothetical protein JNK47_10810 [Mesorhizobium sp.]|nr:hypothetical protein [Mesorhizobium sp.]
MQQNGQQPMSLASLAAPSQGQVTRAPLPDIGMDPSQRVARGFSDERSPMPTAAPKQDRLPQGSDIFGRFMRTVKAGGVNNPAALSAIAATGSRESGFKAQNAFGQWDDPSQSGQPGTSGGIMSWRGPRLQALQQFAQQAGDDPNSPSPETQAQFLVQEDPSLIQKLNAARSPQEAQELMNAAWRFAGHDQPGGETAARMQEVERYAQQFGASPSQGALENLAVGQSMPMGSGQMPQPQGGSLSTGGFNLDPTLMKQLMANPITRPLAIDVARSRIAAMQDQGDPMKKLAYEKALLEVDQLRRGDVKPTDDMREYQYSQRDPGFAQYQLDQKRASATNVNVGSEKGYDKTLGEGYAKRFMEIQDGSQTAQRALNALDVMDQAMSDPGFYSGAASGSVTALKRYGQALGIEGADGIDSIETFNAMAKQAALDSMGGSLGSGFSNADRDFVLDQVPNLQNTPQGNKQLVGIQRKLNQRKQQVAQLARQYAERNGGRINAGFDDELARWSEANPLFPDQPKGSGATRGAGSSTGRQRARNPQTGEELEWDGQQWSPVR